MNDHVPSIHLAASPIHGTGAVAASSFAAGERVIEYTGERIDKAESIRRCAAGHHAIFYLDEETDIDGGAAWNPARFLNHSCAPNCDAEWIEGRIWIIARRPVAPGEEMTFNYGYDLIDYREHPCRCGAVACVGFIVADVFHEHLREKNVSSTQA